jgi:hypothetical protein
MDISSNGTVLNGVAIGKQHSRVRVLPWQRPSTAPAPLQGAPGSSGWLGAPSHCLWCSSLLELAATKAAHILPTVDPFRQKEGDLREG